MGNTDQEGSENHSEIKIEDVGTGELSAKDYQGAKRPESSDLSGSLDPAENTSGELFEEIGDLKPEDLRALKKKRAAETPVLGKLPIVVGVVIFAALLLFGYLFWQFYQSHYSPDYSEADVYRYYSVGSEGTSRLFFLSGGKQCKSVALLENHKFRSDYYALEYDGEVYLPLAYVQTELNKRFYYDEEGKTVLYALPDQVVRYATDSGEDRMILVEQIGLIDGGDFLHDPGTDSKEHPDEVEIIEFANTHWVGPYIPVKAVAEYTDIVWNYYENPGRVTVVSDFSSEPVGVKGVSTPKNHEIPVRTGAGVKSQVLTYLSVGEEAQLLSMEGSKWMKVETGDGCIGYVQKKYLSDAFPMTLSHEFEEPVYKNLTMSNHICMLWHQIFEEDTGVEALPDIVSRSNMANVVCPTVFSLADSEGNLQSRASAEYVDYAHDHGLFVWAMVENISLAPDSYEFLRSYTARTKCIDEMIRQCREYHFDGINVDFESLSETCGVHYLEFLRELSVECRKEGLFLSVDNYVPMSYSAFYDRQEQGKIVDYVIVMCYDEHWGGSNNPGSTASLPFVKKGIEDTMKEVPADRLICGVPFYTRLWNMNDYSSKAISMRKCEELESLHKDGLSWDQSLGQSVLSYSEDGEDGTVPYQVWLEDLKSTRTRLDMISDYELAGVSFWKAGMDEDAVWEEIRTYMQMN